MFESLRQLLIHAAFELGRPIPHIRNAQYFIGEALDKVTRELVQEMLVKEFEKVDTTKGKEN